MDQIVQDESARLKRDIKREEKNIEQTNALTRKAHKDLARQLGYLDWLRRELEELEATRAIS